MSVKLIQSQTLSGSTASVTFSNIPQTFKMLRLVMSTRMSGSTNWGDNPIQLNGSSVNFTERYLFGTGSSTASAADSTIISAWSQGSTSTSSTFASCEIVLPNYTSSTSKAVSLDAVTENNATAALQILVAGLWANSAAITSITVSSSYSNYVAGSSFTLYGLS